MRTRQRTAVILAVCLVLQGCAIHTRSQSVKLTTAVEKSLDDLQDALRHACNDEIASKVPYTPIADCTPAAASYGLTTNKFRNISEGLALAFDFEHDTLVPSLRLWTADQPAPKAFSDFARIIDQVLAIARTVSANPAYKLVLDAIQLVSDELGRLGVTIKAFK
jgi:hypothetical protein